MTDDAPILVLNAGSSSIKFAVFGADPAPLIAGLADGIGGGVSRLKVGKTSQESAFADHKAALTSVLAALAEHGYQPDGLRAAAHRVVHGGARLSRAARITHEVRAEIAACAPLAPLHNPHNLAAIDLLAELTPALPQFASFDTSFHATIPDVAARYAVPTATEAMGIRRYGFHGLSYAGLVRQIPDLTGAAIPRRLLAFHLGNGASICAIRDGQSVATSMGYSPLEGLTMGTRSGSIDPNAVLRLAQDFGIQETATLLNNQSGLLALSSGASDMRSLLASSDPRDAFAVQHFCYWALRHAGGLIMALGGLDGIAFTGGIGENASPIRHAIAEGLGWLGLQIDPKANAENATQLHGPKSTISAWCIPADEERQIALEALSLLTSGS